jgi:hypothetical protein
MKGFRSLTIAVAAVGSLAFATVSAEPASALCCYVVVHGYGPTQADAQSDAEGQLDQIGCMPKGSNHFTQYSTGWEDTLAGYCPQ